MNQSWRSFLIITDIYYELVYVSPQQQQTKSVGTFPGVCCSLNLVKQENVWDMLHTLASLDQCTRATLNAVLRAEMAKWPWRSRSMPPLKLVRGQTEIPKILSQNGQNDLEGQGQRPPCSIPSKSIPVCMFGANLVIVAQIYDELSCRKAEFPRILSQNGQNDLEG